MDETSIRLENLERKVRSLLWVGAVLTVAVAAQMLGWLPHLRKGEIKADRIVLSEGDRFVEISSRGITLADSDGAAMHLTAPSSAESSITMYGPKGFAHLGSGTFEVGAKEGGVVQVKTGAAEGAPFITILGNKGGQVDIGAGFAAVTGTGGSTVIDGRRDSLGLRVTDEKGETSRVPAKPR